jgi:hypothetical protein
MNLTKKSDYSKHVSPQILIFDASFSQCPYHIFASDLSIQLFRRDSRVRSRWVSHWWDQFSVEDDVVLISVQIATTKLTWQISLAMLTEDNDIRKPLQRRAWRYIDGIDNLHIAGMHCRRSRDDDTVLNQDFLTSFRRWFRHNLKDLKLVSVQNHRWAGPR